MNNLLIVRAGNAILTHCFIAGLDLVSIHTEFNQMTLPLFYDDPKHLHNQRMIVQQQQQHLQQHFQQNVLHAQAVQPQQCQQTLQFGSQVNQGRFSGHYDRWLNAKQVWGWSKAGSEYHPDTGHVQCTKVYADIRDCK